MVWEEIERAFEKDREDWGSELGQPEFAQQMASGTCTLDQNILDGVNHVESKGGNKKQSTFPRKKGYGQGPHHSLHTL